MLGYMPCSGHPESSGHLPLPVLQSATPIVWTPQPAVPIIQDLHVTERPWTLHLTDAVQIPALSFSSLIIYRLQGALTALRGPSFRGLPGP